MVVGAKFEILNDQTCGLVRKLKALAETITFNSI